MAEINRVSIVGSGYMGTQIGLQCAMHGYPVSFYDISCEALESSKDTIGEYLDDLSCEIEETHKWKRSIISRLSYFPDLEEAVSNSDLIIEAVAERLDVKRGVFSGLDEVCSDSAILASNSSSIRISKIEDVTGRRDRVLNMHFYSFPWKRRIVEIMRGKYTSNETFEKAKKFSKSIGLTPLIVLKESTGFIFNRVWRAIKKECLHLVDQGVATHEDVDRAWISLYKTPAGPFGMMDRVGLDVVRDIELVYYHESGDSSDYPPKLLIDKIEQGELGVRTGKGFYTYPGPAYTKPGWLYPEDT